MPRKSHRDAISPPPTPSRKSAHASRTASAAATPAKPKVTEKTVKQETVRVNSAADADAVVRSTKRNRAAVSYDEDAELAIDGEEAVATPKKKSKKSPRKSAAAHSTAVKVEKVELEADGRESDATPAQKKTKKAASKTKTASKAGDTQESTTAAVKEEVDADGTQDTTVTTTTTATAPKPKRKTKAEKAAEMLPLATRTPHLLKIGAHVSAAGGIHQTIPNALHIGANAFACFLKSQRKWANPDLKAEHCAAFHDACEEHAYSAAEHVVPHGSYLVNLANPDEVKREQAYAGFIDDLKRCERLGVRLYNFHPGNTNGTERTGALARLAGELNRAHRETSGVVTLLENMAAAPETNTLGGSFADLAAVIENVENKARVGVCLDTCHAFAAGYDIRSPEAYKRTMTEFDEVVGKQYLRAVHVNDSKGVLGSHRDLHQNIGLGFIGLRGFWNVMNDRRFEGVPMVLETPIDRKGENGKDVEDKGIWARETKLLESLVGMDVEGEEFRKLESELAEKGTEERKKLQDQFDKKHESPKKKKGKGKQVETSDEDEE